MAKRSIHSNSTVNYFIIAFGAQAVPYQLCESGYATGKATGDRSERWLHLYRFFADADEVVDNASSLEVREPGEAKDLMLL